MSEKRLKIKIDSKGNVSGTTVSGFAGTNCQETMDQVFAVINGECVKSGDTDDASRIPDPLAYIVGEGN